MAADRLGPLTGRVAAAPISWGVCEVPGWGAMLPASRVLAEMRSLGLRATELGAPGFLPQDPRLLSEMLAAYGMSLIGGFVPLVLHDAGRRAEALAHAEHAAALFAACGGTRLVTAAVEDYHWPRPTPLSRDGIQELAAGLDQVDEICAQYGLTQVLHPHVDTLVETARDVELVLEQSTVLWCLDTGHLQIGGVDPVAFAKSWGHRVAHVHLKDVRNDVARSVIDRERTLVEAVQAGLFAPLGTADVAVDEVVAALEACGFAGWYVLEQDMAITGALPPEGTGPVQDVNRSLEFLADRIGRRLAAD